MQNAPPMSSVPSLPTKSCAVIAVVIAAALFELCLRVVLLLFNGLIDPADQKVLQALFGMMLTVLIALEFNHSITEVFEREHSIVQVRTVALLALVCKFIILDTSKTEPLTIIGQAGVRPVGRRHLQKLTAVMAGGIAPRDSRPTSELPHPDSLRRVRTVRKEAP